MKDIEEIPGSGDYTPSLELLHRDLLKSKQTTRALGPFIDSINILLQNGVKFNPSFSPESFKLIKAFIIKNKIEEGDIAVVNDKKYLWDDTKKKWVEYTEKAGTKKLVSVKGDIDAEKEETYNKKILELLRSIEKDKGKMKQLRDFYNEDNKGIMTHMLKVFVKQNIVNGLKYNSQKLMLEKLEVEKTKSEIESPHERLRDKILQVYELDIKYKALQMFIDKYCKKGKENWYYCIDTNVKLLPTFFSKLATAYLVTDNYEDVLELICLEQGALSDNGDKWVDKYSGYIIKNIEFDYDEGYTETDLKMLQEVLLINQINLINQKKKRTTLY